METGKEELTHVFVSIILLAVTREALGAECILPAMSRLASRSYSNA